MMAGKDQGEKPAKGGVQHVLPPDRVVTSEANEPESATTYGMPYPPTPGPGQGHLVNMTRDDGDTPSRPQVEAIAPTGAAGPPPGPRLHRGYDAERAAYSRLKPGLLETSLGRFVVLVGDEMAGPFDDFRVAYVAGRRRFGPGPLYIKQVLAQEPVFEPIRLEPCPS